MLGVGFVRLVLNGTVATGTCGAGRGPPRPYGRLGLGKGSEGLLSNPKSEGEGWSQARAAAQQLFGAGTFRAFLAGLGPGGKGLKKDEENRLMMGYNHCKRGEEQRDTCIHL